MRVSAVIPVHNEMCSIGEVVRECLGHCDEVVVVDDGSTDETYRKSLEAGATVIRNETNSGVVRATAIGLKQALGEVVVTLDGDGQHDPSEIPSLVAPIVSNQADLALGARSIRPLSERFLAIIVGESVDVGTGFRAIRRSYVNKIDLHGFCLCGIIQLEARRLGARVVEVPIHLRPRRHGRSHWSTFSRGITHLQQATLLLSEVATYRCRRSLEILYRGTG